MASIASEEAALESQQKAPGTVEEYIAAFPPGIQAILQEIRTTIRRAAPQATERLSYKMPTFFLNRVIVHFGAFKTHIGLFPPVKDPDLIAQTAEYRGEKGNLKFPLDRPIPYALIGKIVAARARAIEEKAAAKRGGRRSS